MLLFFITIKKIMKINSFVRKLAFYFVPGT